MTLGALCREMGETEYSYTQSFKAFEQDWLYHNAEAGLVSSTSRLKKWFQTLDDDMKAAIAALSDDDGKKVVHRGSFESTVDFQLEFYLQAVLIFLGKATIFLRAMNKPLPQAFQDYIG